MSENLSVLTKARQAYQPKLPVSLKNGALSVKINKGAATESVSDQAKIKELFPNTYGLPVVQFEAAEAKAGKASTTASSPFPRIPSFSVSSAVRAVSKTASTLKLTTPRWTPTATPVAST